jgi:hypothetical protein
MRSASSHWEEKKTVGVEVIDQPHVVKVGKSTHVHNRVIMRQKENTTASEDGQAVLGEKKRLQECGHAYKEMCTALNACGSVRVCDACMKVQFLGMGTKPRKEAERELAHLGGRVMAFKIGPARKAGCTLRMAETWCIKREWHAEQKLGFEGPTRPGAHLGK